ncbi:probable extracellular nuclease [Jejuia pallidilutea]|uniref:Probable extracellular nuclease n=2 Tax=Jejuia pallidilutea TaxID=504487 RepID=A0A098LSZ5_9FLAO|nr:probable extracellular nuclease [Jejuia pallidilutea]
MCLFLALNSFSQIWYVNSGGDDGNGGTSSGDAFASIGAANAAATSGDFVIIEGTITQENQVVFDKDLNIIGTSNATINRLPGATYRLFFCDTDNVSLSFEDLVLNGGAAEFPGGAFATFKNVDVSFTRCTFNDFDTSASTSPNVNGGAIILNGFGTANFDGCVFNNNTAGGDGGAIFANTSGSLQIKDCLFNGNESKRATGVGGAVASWQAVKLNIIGSTFYDNTADFFGGAIWSAGTETTSSFENITVFNNRTLATGANPSVGGGCRVSADPRPFLVVNSLFYGNEYGVGPGSSPSGPSDMVLANPLSATVINTLSGTTIPTPVDGSGGDTVTSSNLAADLTSSNLMFNVASGFVEYGLPAPGDPTPINFGSDGEDVGAWDSMLTLSSNNFEIQNGFEIYTDSNRNLIEIKNNLDQQISVEIFDIVGKLVFKVNKLGSKVFINSNNMPSGVYIAVIKTKNANGAKKFLIN